MKNKIIKLIKKEISNAMIESHREDLIEKLNLMIDDIENNGDLITKDNIHLYYEFMSDKDLKKHQDLFVCVYYAGNIGEKWKIVEWPKYINWGGWFYVINLDNKAIVEYLIKSQNKQSFDFNLLKNEFSEMAINQFQKI
jgi:hypothetical protein